MCLREKDLISNSATVLAAGYDWDSQVSDWNPKTDNFEMECILEGGLSNWMELVTVKLAM